MDSSVDPTFRDLNREECERVLERNHIGRIAFSRGRRIEIVPVHYVYSDGWIYGRTTPGGRIETAGRPWWPVAFQVDEVSGLFDWKSVVVHGGLYKIPAEGAKWEREAWQTGLDLLRSLIPQTLRGDDPVPEHRALFRIATQEVSGRKARLER